MRPPPSDVSRFINAYDNVTTMTAASSWALILGTIATFTVPRRFVFLPLVLVCSFVSDSQRLVIAGMDFDFMRLLMLVCWARLAIRGELRSLKRTPIDMVFVAWIGWRVVASVIRTASVGTLVNQLGHSLDALGIYFLGRMTIRNWRDVDAMIVSYAIVVLPVAVSMAYEFMAGWNFASIFSGSISKVAIREGEIRATCGYAHPITAGAFWAGMVPLLFARLWKPRSSRVFSGMAACAAVVCVVSSSSSTPLLGTMIAGVGAAAWRLRRHMRWVRWALVGVVIFLQVAMEKPIWHLFQRVSAIGLSASTGYHRYRLFDAFVNHFLDWAPLGLNSTLYWGRQLDDVTNAFIAEAIRGGLLGLVLFITLFVLLFQRNGRLLRAYRGHRALEIALWGLGVSLFTHVAMMNAMGYLSQMFLPWYACFAMIAGTPFPRPASEPAGPRRRRKGLPVETRAPAPRPHENAPALGRPLRGSARSAAKPRGAV